MSPFDEATALQPLGDDAFTWVIPDGWQQGRGAWGGLVVGALTRAVTVVECDLERRVRSVSAQLSAPAMVGVHSIHVRLVRRGSAVTTWAAVAADQDGSTVASMVAITGSPRAPVQWQGGIALGTALPPQVPPPRDVAAIVTGPPFPVYMQHCEFRPISGVPFSGSGPVSSGWLRLAEPSPATEASLLALVDAWWPASLAIVAEMPRIATVNFTANLLVEPATVPIGEPLLLESLVTAAEDGFASEHRRLWTRDGRLAVDNLQSMVIGG